MKYIEFQYQKSPMVGVIPFKLKESDLRITLYKDSTDDKKLSKTMKCEDKYIN